MKKNTKKNEQKGSLAFHLVCSNTDILSVVEGELRSKGILGVTDLNGRVNYLIDSRWGAKLGARRVHELSEELLRRCTLEKQNLLLEATIVVDACLDSLYFRRHLRGYVLLRQCLIGIYLDNGLVSPMSKSIFPEVAKIFKCSVANVERNLRYLFEKLGEDESYIRSVCKGDGKVPLYIGVMKQGGEQLLFNADNNYSIRTCLSRLGELLKLFRNKYLMGELADSMNRAKIQEDIELRTGQSYRKSSNKDDEKLKVAEDDEDSEDGWR